MDSNLITKKVYAVVSSVLPYVCQEDLKDETNLFEIGLDSINAMTLIFNLQTAFDVQFEATDINLENFNTVGNIVRLLCQKPGILVDA